MKRDWTHTLCRPAFVLGFWMAVALLLRLFRLTHESLWWDEYTSHVFLDAPSLFEFLTLNRTLDPLTLPFYYSLEYLWTQYVHGSVLSLRMMSIAIGLATLPLVYGLGARLYGRQAGYLAVALLALSPVHIHHSQGIRMYGLFVLLAVLTVWSFIKILDEPRAKYWLLHLSASVLMYWTHPFAGLVPAVIGGFLLLRYRARTALFWRWTLAQVVLFAPTVAYLASVRFWPEESTSVWLERPSLGALLADLFFDDISAFHWQFRLGPFAERLGAVRLMLDVLFAGLIVAALLALAWRLARDKKYPADARAREITLLTVIWLLLPPLMLFVVSWLVRPCMFPRYTVYCIVPLYVLLAGGIASLRKDVWRRAAPGVLVVMMALQWAWLQPGPQRTDWRGAGLLLHEESGEDDVVLVESLLWRDVFLHNLRHLTPGMLDAPVAAAEKTSLLAAQSALCLGMLEKHPPGRVYVVIALRYFDPGPPVIYEQGLARWGIPFERWFFPAIREVYVYRLEMPGPHLLPASMAELFARWENVEPGTAHTPGVLDSFTQEAFGDLAMALAETGRTDMALEIFEGLFAEEEFTRQLFGNVYDAIRSGAPTEHEVEAVKSLWRGYGFRGNEQSRHAARAFERAVELDPGHAVANLELGYERYGLGEYQGAAEAFERAAGADARYRMLGNLVEALRNDHNVENAFEAVQAYRRGILYQSRGEYDAAAAWLRRAVAADPHLADAHTSLVFVLIVQRRLEEAGQALDAYFALGDPPVPGAYGLLAVLHIAREELDEALRCVEKARTLDEAYGRQFGPMFDALLRDRDYEKTVAALDALKADGVDLYPLMYEYVADQLR